MTDRIVELQGQVFDDLDALCASLDDAQWDLDTDCPGWTVKDNLSHIIGTEEMLLGRPGPDHTVEPRPHFRNDIGAANEVPVDYRRPWPPSKVFENFREVAAERMAALRAMSDEDLSADSWTPVGPGTVRDLVAVRVMDCWVHEQDIRRAIGRPGNLEGPVADHALARHRTAIPYVVGKKAGAPDGSTVVVEVDGMDPIAVGVEGRAKPLDEVPVNPDVRLKMDRDTFNRLCCGRGDPKELIPRVQAEGDVALRTRILENFNFMV